MLESAKAGGGSKATFDKEEGTLHICLASESKCVESVCSDEWIVACLIVACFFFFLLVSFSPWLVHWLCVCLLGVPPGTVPTIPLKVNTDIATINTLEKLYHTLEADNAHRVSNHQENYTKHNTPGEDTAKCPTIKLGVLENYTPHQRETTVQGVQPPRLVRCMSPPHLISMSHPPVCMINSKLVGNLGF